MLLMSFRELMSVRGNALLQLFLPVEHDVNLGSTGLVNVSKSQDPGAVERDVVHPSAMGIIGTRQIGQPHGIAHRRARSGLHGDAHRPAVRGQHRKAPAGCVPSEDVPSPL